MLRYEACWNLDNECRGEPLWNTKSLHANPLSKAHSLPNAYQRGLKQWSAMAHSGRLAKIKNKYENLKDIQDN